MKPADPPLSISRRGFLRQGSAGASLWMLAMARAEAAAAPPGPDSSWQAVRDQFDLDPAVVHMTGMLFSSHPRPVREAIAHYRTELDLNPPAALRRFANREEAGREAAARYLAADSSDIALTDSTTMGLGLLYHGIRIRSDQEILSTKHDHLSTNASLDYKAAVAGCAIKRISLFETSAEADAGEIVRRIRSAIDLKTRILAVTYVHSSSGVKLPLARIGAMVEEINQERSAEDRLLFCVDGVHGFGIEDINVTTLACDFFVAGCHKWLFGPRGTGIVWGRKESWSQVSPIIPTFSGRSTPGRLMTPGGFHSDEHRWALAEAFEFHLAIGKARIQQRIHALNTLLKQELVRIPGLTLHTPPDAAMSSGITCFEIAGHRNAEVVRRLAEQKITASTTPYAAGYARLSPGLLNDEDEIARTIDVLRRIATS